jgi:hypothetical protein
MMEGQMIIKQTIRAADDESIGFEIAGSEWTPVPHTGDIIHWTANAKDYVAQVKSKSFSYDRSEVSIARADDWGVTVTVIVDILDVTNAVDEARAAAVS